MENKFVNVKLRREDVEDMISTYESLSWSNEGDEKRSCNKILKSLKKSINEQNV